MHLTNVRGVGGAAWISMRAMRRGAASLLATLALACLAAPGGAAVPGHSRTWELVTPGPTNSVPFIAEEAWSADGNRVAFLTVGPLPGSSSGEVLAIGLSTRTPSGWVAQPLGVSLDSPSVNLFPTAPAAVTPDLSDWLWSSVVPLLPGAPPEPNTSLYARPLAGGLTLRADAGDGRFTFAGASDDLEHVVFEATGHLLPADANRIVGGGDVYELDGSQVRLLAVDAGGAALSTCGSRIGGVLPLVPELTAISRDGARVFFSAPDAPDCLEPRRVYLREGGTTTEISASACTRADCDAPQDVTFAGATPDGAHAFLVTAQQLTNDDVDESADLYRYDVADGQLTRLSTGPPGALADVSPIVRASQDGQRAYFLATGQLVPGEGIDGSPNLYLSDHGTVRFVASPSTIDLASAAISDDGGALAFSTASALRPDDVDGRPDVYRWDAGSGALDDVSAPPGGADGGEYSTSFGGSELPLLARQQQRWMSADGRRVLFLTREPLLPEDHNEVEDVYEWADGTLALISSGAVEASAVTYGGVSADGRSVFFSTNRSLIAADRDGGDQDLYVARLDGGFPDGPPAPPPCDGDACQGPPAERVAQRAPATLGYAEPADRALHVHVPGRQALRRLAATGHLTLTVDAPLAGRVALVARARIHGRSVAVGGDARRAPEAGDVLLRLRLSPAARRALRRDGVLRVTVTLRHSRLDAARTFALVLRSAR